MGRIEEVESEISRLKGELSRLGKTADEARRWGIHLRDLQRELAYLKDRSGIVETDDELLAQYEAAKARFLELSEEPSKTDEFRMMGLANKLRHLEDELRSRGMEV